MAQLDWYIRANLKPRHLQLVVALDDLRNVRRVADYLHVTQPAISKALAELERGMGLKLFNRTSRGVTPTEFGECLVRHARRMAMDLGSLRDELRALTTGASGSVSVGVLPAAAPVLVPKSVAELKRRSPTTTVILREGTAETLLADLRGGGLDIVVGTLPPVRLLAGIAEQVLYTEQPLVLVCGAHHPLVKARKVRWRDLGEFPWIIPPAGTSMREPLEQLFAKHQLPLPLDRIESVSIVANKTILQETLAIGLFSIRIAEHYKELGIITILPLEVAKLVGPVATMWGKDRPLTPAAKLMIACLESSGAA